MSEAQETPTLAQVGVEGGEDLNDVTEMLGQLDTHELNELSDMLQGVNDGLNLAQAKGEKIENDDWERELRDNYF